MSERELPPLARWLRSTHVRLLLLLVIAELATGAAMLGLMARQLQVQIDRLERTLVTETRDDLIQIATDEGPAALARTIGEQVAVPRGAPIILLADRAGRRIAGNLDGWPAEVPTPSTLRFIQFVADKPDAPMMTVAQWLGPDRRLLVARPGETEDALRAAIEGALALAFLVVVPLALLGGWLAVRVLDGRVQAVNAVAGAVGAGELSRRVARDGSGDSFDRLARNVNAMLSRIEQLVEELRYLSDSLSHDLRSPITRLRARIEQAQASDDPARMSADLPAIRREADHLLAMLDAAREISRAEAGVGRERIVAIDLAALIRDLAELYEPLVEESGRTMAVDVPASLTCPVHRELIGQAVANLIDNALKYGDGRITVALHRAAETAVIEVADEGGGIAPDERDLALRRFGRLDRARTRDGAGLGLSLVSSLARLHRGELRFSSTGGGFAVQLALPLDGTQPIALT